MRQQQLFAIAACLCSAAVVLVSAVPLPAGNQELDMLQIPLSDGKELDVLTLGAKDQEQIIAERNKRTIGLLRELFPDITKQIDDIVNRIIGQVIRVAGPSLLPALLGNNRPTTERSDFDADFDDDDDTSNDVNSQETNSVSAKSDVASPAEGTTSSSSSNDNGGTRVNIALPTFPPEDGASIATTTATNKVSLAQDAGEATTGVAKSTSTTTAAAATTTTPTPTPVTTSPTTAATTSPQTTTVLTTTSSRPVEISTTPTTTTATSANPITVPTPIPTFLSPTLPTTTINSILVIPRNKGQSTSNIPISTTQLIIDADTESSFTTTSTPIAIPIATSTPTQYSTSPPPISDILNTATTKSTVATETLPTPTIPATYLGTFDGRVGEQELQKPSTLPRSPSSLSKQQQSQTNALPFAVDVDRSQLVALVDNINRLLNSPNLLITNRNNVNTPTFTTTANTITTTTPSIAVSTQSPALDTTIKITKLLPVAN
ncbi:uncharacterized protein LOC129237150 isoform X1 [Anastrepha obliqua]|uniref:uncharacterized protein LOC129237150 isoform X1 n=1 Tax=Anastrepha obliqua TaxID=95512 RepID=UPI0024099578|nr:uncharacterized protein LOC129237150 isoform X1 [Anastrepha obliqua]